MVSHAKFISSSSSSSSSTHDKPLAIFDLNHHAVHHFYGLKTWSTIR